MSVTFFDAGPRVDSGGSPVTHIDVPRPAGVAVGDFVVVFGVASTASDWSLNVADGVPFARLFKSGFFQAWGKFLAPGFGDTVTGVDLPTAVPVQGIVSVFYRGAVSVAALGGSTTLAAPALVGAAGPGRVAHLFGAASASSVGLSATGSVRVAGTADIRPLLITDTTYAGGTVPGVTATKTGAGSLTSKFAFSLALTPNAPPDAPDLVSPIDPANPVDRTVTNRLRWNFSSPVDGDRQSRFVLVWHNADFTVSGSVDQTTPNNYWDAPPGTFPADDLQWTAKVYGARGLASPFAPDAFFTAADHPDTATITYPTDGGTVSQVDRIDWSYPEQGAYQVRRVADDDGSPDTGTIYFDTGETDDPDNLVRSLALTFETNNRYEHVQLRTKLDGVWSDWADVRVLVSYTPPPAPQPVVSRGDDGASIAIAYSVPEPEGDEPAATSVDIWYSTDGGVTATRYWAGLDVAGNVTYPVPCSGLDYVWQAVAFADNGTTAASDWISMFDIPADQVV